MRDAQERGKERGCISCDDSILDIASSFYRSIHRQSSFFSLLFFLSVCVVYKKKKKSFSCSFALSSLLLPPLFMAEEIGVGQSFDFPVDRPLLLSNRLYSWANGRGRAHLAPDSRRPPIPPFSRGSNFPDISRKLMFFFSSCVDRVFQPLLSFFFFFFDFLLRRFCLGQLDY